MEQKPVNILWTSGWDSTFRVIDLLSKGETVQPYYIKLKRKSLEMELQTIEKISNYLLSVNPEFKKQLLPLIEIEENDIIIDKKIYKAYSHLSQNEFLGNQIVQIASFAKQYDFPNIELSIHEDDQSVSILRKYSKRIIKNYDEYYILEENIDENIKLLYERFSFPLFDTTKIEMLEKSKKYGLQEVMEMTWFCHKPLKNGQPCGICNPCIYTKDEGLGRRVPNPPIYKKCLRFIKRSIKKFILRKPISSV